MIPNGSEAEMNCPSGNFICGVVEGFYGKPWTTEQRKKLFRRMRKMSMNTYIYAPKDDCKHRMYWRDLYSVEEADHLTGLIESAEENNVSFVYAISPGLDMTYSNSKEVTCLKRKLEQVASFGCKAFAVLFDDIEVDMCAPDKEVFQSFAHAQVSVTNEVYQHLGQPTKFFFCPTEYCASRAVPNVPSSGYLNIIGSKLLPGVDVMWTGPKVVSKRITVKSVLELTEVLHRPPIIWDNIHANDYDQKRLFLGPYDGRSPELIPYLRGVMTNPNCEFEPNYIAMHTLGQWSRSTIDGTNREMLLSQSPVSADIKLETDGDFSSDEDIPVNLQGRYKPKQALTIAMNDWLEEFFEEVGMTNTKMVEVTPPPMLIPTINPLPVPCSLTGLPIPIPGINNINELPGLDRIDSFIQPVIIAPVNSLLDPPSSSDSDSDSVTETMEPMDCVVTPGSSPTCSDSLIPHSEVCVEIRDTCNVASSSDSMQVDSDGMPTTSGLWQDTKLPAMPSISLSDKFSFEDLAFLVDMFYLPFEHGFKATSLLTEFHWLKCNAHATTNGKLKGATTEQVDAAAEWQSRALQFQEKLQDVISIIDRLMAVPNKALVQDLFPYVWDLKGLMMLIDTFISWLAIGHVSYISVCYMQGSPYTWGNGKYIESFMSGEQEPWIFRGGLQGEFQRMLPLDGAADLLYSPCPKAPGDQTLLRVRPYTAQDEAAVYEICRRTCDDGMDGTEIFPNHLDLIGDRLVSTFIILSPQYCFVVEDDQGVCGYVLAALDSKELHSMAELAIMTEMRAKYPKPEKVEGLSPAEEMICSFHTSIPFCPNTLTSRFPSLIRMDMLADRVAVDVNAPRRALAGAVAALKFNGSHGMYTEINVGDHNTVEMYKKYALCEVPLTEPREDLHILGRVF